MDKILDRYNQFFDYVKKEDFFNFGIKNIITIDKETVSLLWKNLLNNINSKSKDLYIISFGRNGSGNDSFRRLYKEILDIEINYDPTNNQKPTQLIEKNTIYRKNKNIFNYQVSHVFGNTKNVYCFTAPWNIVYIPKILDPFTGHEAKGEYIEEFKILFYNLILQKFSNEIEEYNNIMEKIYPKINKWVDNNIPKKDKKYILKEFNKINIKSVVDVELLTTQTYPIVGCSWIYIKELFKNVYLFEMWWDTW